MLTRDNNFAEVVYLGSGYSEVGTRLETHLLLVLCHEVPFSYHLLTASCLYQQVEPGCTPRNLGRSQLVETMDLETGV